MAQRLSREPGWYPDAIGDAGAFRWWNGTEWTTAVADSLWAPEPEDPGLFHRPDRPVVAAPSAPTVVELDEPPPYRKPLLIGAAALVIAGGLFGGGLWVFTGDDDSSSQSSHKSSGSDDSGASRARSEPDSPDRSQSPRDEDDQDGPNQPDEVLTFPNPGEKWVEGHGVVPHSTVRRLITEQGYNGEDDWGAIIVSGDLPQGVTAKAELARTTDEVADWFGEVAFGADENPETDVIDRGPDVVMNRPAHTIELRVDYDIEDLEADWDRTTITVIDLGPGRRPGVFLASVPDTNPGLRKVVDEAGSSVTLSKPAAEENSEQDESPDEESSENNADRDEKGNQQDSDDQGSSE